MDHILVTISSDTDEKIHIYAGTYEKKEWLYHSMPFWVNRVSGNEALWFDGQKWVIGNIEDQGKNIHSLETADTIYPNCPEHDGIEWYYKNDTDELSLLTLQEMQVLPAEGLYYSQYFTFYWHEK